MNVCLALFFAAVAGLASADKLDDILAKEGTWNIAETDEPAMTCFWKKGDDVFETNGGVFLTAGSDKDHTLGLGKFHVVEPGELPNIDYDGPCWGSGTIKPHSKKHAKVDGILSGNGWGPINFKGIGRAVSSLKN